MNKKIKITESQLKVLLEQMDDISEPYIDNSSVENDDYDDYQERHHGLEDIDMDSELDENYYDDVKGMMMVDKSDRHRVDDKIKHDDIGTGRIHHIFKSPEGDYLYGVKFDSGQLGKFKGHEIKECGYVPINESVEKIKGIFRRFV